MQIRHATPDDIDPLVELKCLLVRQAWSDDPHYLDAYPDYRDRLRARLAELLISPTHQYWVAELGNRVVGVVSASVSKYLPGPDWSGISAHMSDLVVEEAARGQGIAKALMHEGMQWCREQGAWGIELHATRMARRMYEAMGWHYQEPEDRNGTFVTMCWRFQEAADD